MSKSEILKEYEDIFKRVGKIKDESLQKKAQSLQSSLNFFKSKPAQSSIHFNSTKGKGARKKPSNARLAYEHNTRTLNFTDSRIAKAEKNQDLARIGSPIYALDTPERNEYKSITRDEFLQLEMRAREDYRKAWGQSMQKKAQIFKESIVNLQEHHTMQDLENLTQRLKKEYNLNALHIAIHRDEGHINKLTHEKQYNYHAHIIFLNYDFTTHKSVFRQFSKKDLSRMQDLNAEVLGMQRGKKHKREHINRYQLDHKANKILENIHKLTKEIKQELKHHQSQEFNAEAKLIEFLKATEQGKEQILQSINDSQAHAMNKLLAQANNAELPTEQEPKKLLRLRSKWQYKAQEAEQGKESQTEPTKPKLSPFKSKPTQRSKTMEKDLREQELQEAREQELQEAEQEALESSFKAFEMGTANRQEMVLIIENQSKALQKLAKEHKLEKQDKQKVKDFCDIVKNKEYLERSDTELKNFTQNIINYKRKLSAEEQGITKAFSTDFDLCKTPKAKDERAEYILNNYAKQYKDIDKAVSIMQKAETGLKKPQNQEAKISQEEKTEERGQEGDSSTLDRAVNEIQNSRNVFDFLRCLYDLEKGMYELGIGKKPNPQEFSKKLNEMKDKALSNDFIKQSLNKIKECKDKIQDFSKNIKLEIAFARQINKDIELHDYSTHKDTKQEYVRRIDKKLESALKECPNIRIDYPKMYKRAEEITKNRDKSKNQNKGVER